MTGSDRHVSAQNDDKAKRGGSKGTRIFIRDIIVIFLAAIIISVGIKAFLIRSFYIPSGSMMNTLQINDRIIVNELVPRAIPIQHGDVVVFKDPGGWLHNPPALAQNPVATGIDWVLSVVGLSAPDSNDHLIKRVIGLPGDRVACCNAFGQMSVNDIPLVERYLDLPADVSRVSGTDFSVTVPAGRLWVMGDNRYDSADSRFNTGTPSKGFVPETDVVGRAFLISWPANRWTWLDNYPTVFSGVVSTTSKGQ